MEAPERIYLQTGFTKWDEGEPWPTDGVTWCDEQVHDSDVEYVRRDVAAGLRKALLRRVHLMPSHTFSGTPVINEEAKLLRETAFLAEPEADNRESET